MLHLTLESLVDAGLVNIMRWKEKITGRNLVYYIKILNNKCRFTTTTLFQGSKKYAASIIA